MEAMEKDGVGYLAVSLGYFKTLFSNSGKLNIISAPERSGDVKHTHADISLTEKTFGYNNPISVWDGINMTIKSMGL